jgi:hypothetical protein
MLKNHFLKTITSVFKLHSFAGLFGDWYGETAMFESRRNGKKVEK